MTNYEKTKLISDLLRQCHSVLNSYGKPVEVLEDRIMAFNMVLKPYTSDDILYAFKDWLGTKSTFPTPVDIKNIIISRLSLRYDGKIKYKGTFTQIIRKKSNQEILERIEEGRHLCPLDLMKKYTDFEVLVSYAQDIKHIA